jgi:hypothetical protein
MNNSAASQHRQRLRNSLRNLIMDNGGHLCYANSAVQAMKWSFLSRTTFTEADWGEYSALFNSLLVRPNNLPLRIENIQGFQTLVDNWPEWLGQADSTEFSSILLQGVASRCCSNRWERRVQEDQRLTVYDHGDDHMPITLQLDLELTDSGTIRLVDLIRHWHHEWGMSAGLVNDTDLICLHLDRLVKSPQGLLRKDDTPIGFCWGIQFPTFTEGINCDWHGYQVMAAISHTGDPNQGHYQALLRVGHAALPGQAPALWLHCDDNRAPQPCWHMPPDFARQVTCFWLCRCEILDHHDMRIMHDLNDTETPADETLDQAMMELLSELPMPTT